MRRLGWATGALLAVLAVAGIALAGTASATHEDDAAVHPGVSIRIEGHGDCTGNFLFERPSDGTVFLGTAAHCVGQDLDATVRLLETSASPDGPPPREGPVLGEPAYSSWEVRGVTSQTCAVVLSCSGHPEDFALVEVREALVDRVDPAVQGVGGPTGVEDADAVERGDAVASYGNSSIRPGPSEIDAREGAVTRTHGPWTAYAAFATPGVPGDSGSPVLAGDGDALGVLVTLSGTGENGIALMDPLLDRAEDELGELVLRTAPPGETIGQRLAPIR